MNHRSCSLLPKIFVLINLLEIMFETLADYFRQQYQRSCHQGQSRLKPLPRKHFKIEIKQQSELVAFHQDSSGKFHTDLHDSKLVVSMHSNHLCSSYSSTLVQTAHPESLACSHTPDMTVIGAKIKLLPGENIGFVRREAVRG